MELLADGTIEASAGRVIVASRKNPAARITNNWHQAALSYDPDHSNLALYVDGVQVAQNPNVSRTLPQTEWPLAIGTRESVKALVSYLPPIVGRIDEVAVFRRAYRRSR